MVKIMTQSGLNSFYDLTRPGWEDIAMKTLQGFQVANFDSSWLFHIKDFISPCCTPCSVWLSHDVNFVLLRLFHNINFTPIQLFHITNCSIEYLLDFLSVRLHYPGLLYL